MANGPTKDEKGLILNFTQCPNCASKKRLAYETLRKEIDAGKMPKNSNSYIFKHESVIAKDMNWFSAPVILSFFDMCTECGTVYCIHAEVKLAIQGAKMPNQGMPGSPPFSMS